MIVVLSLRTGIPADVWRRQTDTDIASAVRELRRLDHKEPPPAQSGGPQMSG